MNSELASALRRGMRATASAVAVATLSGCSGDCLALATPSVRITVVDAVTGIAPSSTLTERVSDGTTEDTISANVTPPAPPLPNLPSFESKSIAAGMFRVTVSANGYQTFVREGIRVEPDGNCGMVMPAQITVRLQPVAAP